LGIIDTHPFHQGKQQEMDPGKKSVTGGPMLFYFPEAGIIIINQIPRIEELQSPGNGHPSAPSLCKNSRKQTE